MSKTWLRALMVALLGLGTPRLHAQTTEPPAPPPPNAFCEPPPAPPEFVPPPAPPDEHPAVHLPRWELSAEAVWFLFRRDVPSFPLATIGSVNDAIPGALGQNGTRIIADSSTFNDQFHIGFRTTGTYWLFEPETLGVQASFFLMEQATNAFGASNGGGVTDPVLARPFFNPVLGREDSDPRAIPATMGGNVDIAFTTRFMGADASLLYSLSGYTRYGPNLFALVGPRWIRLDESYTSNELSYDLPPRPTQSFLIQDSFTAQNTFFGVQVGTLFRYRIPGVDFDFLTKIAAGNNHETVGISGNTTITDQNGRSVSGAQGLFAQRSNIGDYERNAFSVVPEVGVKVRVAVTENIKLSVGYNFLYMTHVARPADQMDRNINIQPLNAPTQIGPALPGRPGISDSSFWSHFFSLGLEVVF